MLLNRRLPESNMAEPAKIDLKSFTIELSGGSKLDEHCQIEINFFITYIFENVPRASLHYLCQPDLIGINRLW